MTENRGEVHATAQRGRPPADTLSLCRRLEPVYFFDCVSKGFARMATLRAQTGLMAGNGERNLPDGSALLGDAVTMKVQISSSGIGV